MKPSINFPHRSLPVSRLTIALWLALLLGLFVASRLSADTAFEPESGDQPGYSLIT
jgi:hypothetical protein